MFVVSQIKDTRQRKSLSCARSRHTTNYVEGDTRCRTDFKNNTFYEKELMKFVPLRNRLNAKTAGRKGVLCMAI